MSSGGLLQLVAFGNQDVYISGQPQVTFFRVVYRRHTNFAMESMEQTLTGTADWGRRVTCLVGRNGDLIHRAFLQIDLPALTPGSGLAVAWARNIGHVMIDEISVEIGGTVIDRHYGQWLTIYNELTQTAEKQDGYSVMIGNTAALTSPSETTIPAATLFVPLQFWFCKNSGLALPLIALLHHEVRINISFRPFSEVYAQYTPPTTGTVYTYSSTALASTPSIQNVALFIDYIFLDAPERRMFAQMNHEYLIEQLQFTGATTVSGTNVREKLSFSHPTKELVWVVQPDANIARNRWTDFTDAGASDADIYAGGDPVVEAKLQLGSHDRISMRSGAYYNLVQPYYHHTRIGSSGIYVYSFALKPEEHQPSGSINMSRIESITLQLSLSGATGSARLYVYAVNYNVLRITGGYPTHSPEKHSASLLQVQ